VTLDDGQPNARYYIDLGAYVGDDDCYYWRRAGTFTTNAYGYAKASGVISLPSYIDYVFADIDQEGFHGFVSNDTPFVELP
jgi:hypothetical protein